MEAVPTESTTSWSEGPHNIAVAPRKSDYQDLLIPNDAGSRYFVLPASEYRIICLAIFACDKLIAIKIELSYQKLSMEYFQTFGLLNFGNYIGSTVKVLSLFSSFQLHTN